MWQNTHYQIYNLNIFSVQFSTLYLALYPVSPFISRIFHFLKTEILPVKPWLHILVSPPPWSPLSTCWLCELLYPGTSQKWGQIFIFRSGLFCLLSMVSSGFVHILACVKNHSFLRLNKCSTQCVCCFLSVHLLMNNCIAVHFALCNNASTDVSVHTSIPIPAFSSFGRTLRIGMARVCATFSVVYSGLKLLDTVVPFEELLCYFHSRCTTVHSHQQCKGFHFHPHLFSLFKKINLFLNFLKFEIKRE